VASVWITTRTTSKGERRFRVEWCVGGRESSTRYGGSFKTRREALARKALIAGELAALRVPVLRLEQPARPASLAQAAERWHTARIDLAAGTSRQHRIDVKRAVRVLGDRRLDEITAAEVADLVGRLAADGYARETIKKTIAALAMIFDHEAISPNPARDRRVKLPRAERVEPTPPTAAHVEAVYRTLPHQHRLAFLWLDWSGARVSSVETTRVGDYDQPRRRVRLRASASKSGRALWVELHPVLADAVEQTLGPREDRDPDARLFPETSEAALRVAIGRACTACAVPAFSPHDLRHRRISVLHAQGRSWAEVAEFVGHASKKITADTYTHVIADPDEADYAGLLA
jgi:integrase